LFIIICSSNNQDFDVLDLFIAMMARNIVIQRNFIDFMHQQETNGFCLLNQTANTKLGSINRSEHPQNERIN
jgi:hypothetical protein